MLRGLRFFVFVWTARSYATLHDIKSIIVDYWNIVVAGRARKALGEHQGARGPLDDEAARIAIVAVHPSEESMPSTINLLQALTANQFETIVLSTRVSERYRDALGAHCNTYIERYNIGRDFGAYAYALRRFMPRLMGCEEVILCNDSLFVPRSFTETLNDLLSRKGDWLSLFECHEIHYHSQSFFQIFRKNAVRSRAFQLYWARYVPLSNRIHTIHKGEVGLSRALTKGGFFPSVAYTGRRTIVTAIERLRTKPAGVTAVIQATFGNMLARVLAPLDRRTERSRGVTSEITEEAVFADLAGEISKRFENMNPTHGIGLLVNHLYEAPLKRDLAFRGTHSIGELVNLATGFSEEERSAMERDLRIRGVPSGIRGLRKMLYLTGRL